MVDSLRFGLRRDKTRWLVVPDAPPDDAQMSSMGFVLGSSTLETGHLAPEELKELLLLLDPVLYAKLHSLLYSELL